MRPIFSFSVIPAAYLYWLVYTHTTSLHLRIDPEEKIGALLVLILLDLSSYVHHRLSHEINIIWGTHFTHHTPTEMNLSVTARTSGLEHFFAALAALPFAIIGFSPLTMGLGLAIVRTYMWVLHTEVIRSYGPLDCIFNSPSHHRVHHYESLPGGRIGANYGGILIIWDRLFGTFCAEKTTPPSSYGLKNVSPDMNLNDAHFAQYRGLYRKLKSVNFRTGMRILFSSVHVPPEYREADTKKIIGYPSLAILSAAMFVMALALDAVPHKISAPSDLTLNPLFYGRAFEMVIVTAALVAFTWGITSGKTLLTTVGSALCGLIALFLFATKQIPFDYRKLAECVAANPLLIGFGILGIALCLRPRWASNGAPSSE
ncbi:MAG: sterol desaturase family protein [Bdellovibrionota bacterium]